MVTSTEQKKNPLYEVIMFYDIICVMRDA